VLAERVDDVPEEEIDAAIDDAVDQVSRDRIKRRTAAVVESSGRDSDEGKRLRTVRRRVLNAFGFSQVDQVRT
jgi:hypothetical protein